MEVVPLLTAAKQMGFDLGQMISLAIMYFMLRKDLMKQLDKLIIAIQSLEKAHNERLNKIESHIGLKKE